MHEKIRANMDRIPTDIPEPLVVGRGIDDVAIVVATLTPKPEAADRWSADGLYDLADELRIELSRLDNVGLTYVVGGAANQIRVEPEKLSLYGVTLDQLVGKVKAVNSSFMAGYLRDGGRSVQVAAGQTLNGVPDIGMLLITTRDNRSVYVKYVARIVVGPSQEESRAWNIERHKDGSVTRLPAVEVAVAKRPGANAVVIAEEVLHHIEDLKGWLIPDTIDVKITRDYGDTANEKANELLFHLGLATLSIVLLVGIAIGWREGLVVLRGAGGTDRHSDDDPADAVCRVTDGLHDQPGQSVRADLLHRHSAR